MQNEYRDYEISVWTLQDEFITLLKPSHIENKGQITEGKVIIKDDGTLELSFSIPMYYYNSDRRIENPLWHSTKDGTIIQNMRKIKLIFNKKTEVERVFEFVIIGVEESHKNDELLCNVSCEGLAFNELGKWGYKISLSSDEFYERDYEFFTTGNWKDYYNEEHEESPRATLQYWANHFLIPFPNNNSILDPTKWYYSIEMDWSAYELSANGSVRESDKIYEDQYVGAWQIDENNKSYIPKDIILSKEKERLVDLEESNAYNLTQELAKTFGVFCRYEYIYDDNYYIIGRRVIFYNNYMREKEGYIELTYPYSTAAITRNYDGKDITTKMFVRPVSEETSPTGLITIMNVSANKSREDYIFNFDYLYEVGAITAEQYEEINNYEYKIGQYNRELEALDNRLFVLRSKILKLEAKVTIYTNSIQLDKERISACNALLNELDKVDKNVDGLITISADAPKTAILLKTQEDEESYYLNLPDHGILLEKLHIYKEYNFTNKSVSINSELKTGIPEYDEFGNIVKIKNLYLESGDRHTVYLIYEYRPKLYYDRVLQTWESRLGKDTTALNINTDELNEINNNIEQLQTEYNNKLLNKKTLITEFDKMMGPALRESYWQPEGYTNYGDNYLDYFSIIEGAQNENNSKYTEFIWDDNLFPEEQKITYEYSVDQTIKKYPCIRIKDHLDYIKDNIDKLSFMWYDFAVTNDSKSIRNLHILPVNSLSQYGFINNNGVIEPVLILMGIENLTTDQLEYAKNSNNEPKIGVVTIGNNNVPVIEEGAISVEYETMWVEQDQNIYQVYPRIKIKSLALKINDTQLGIIYNNHELKNYEDFYILTRVDENNSNYYITIKPYAILAQGFDNNNDNLKIKFNLSNADTAIYLDAIKVLKENAYPKLSYTVDPSIINKKFLYSLYNNLNRICSINDIDLKLRNVQGYISELELDLDHPWKDKIEIKNYKNKFEDLFSSIVAQTEAMKKNTGVIESMSQITNYSGEINLEVLQNSLNSNNINYSFNNGKLTLNEENGLLGVSDQGAFSIRNDGIFTATEKDENGNWKWNTGLTPYGFNANLITTGQLDTSKINVYSGDRVRFQLNEDGIFAYKSFFEDFNISSSITSAGLEKISNSSTRKDDLDPAQYVVLNQNGLFLIAEPGALILNTEKTDYISLNANEPVKRVEISWEGLKLRNWNNEEVFYADPNTGNLILKGTVYATNLYIGNNSQNEFDPNVLSGGGLVVDTTNGTIKMFTSGLIQEDSIPAVSISKEGIEFKTEGLPAISINEEGIIMYASGEEVLSIQKEGIVMNTAGRVELRGTKGFIQFGENSEDPAFSVNEEGVVMCKGIICTGDIVGAFAKQSGEGTSAEDPYILYLNETNAQSREGIGEHLRETNFSCTEQIIRNTYVCDIDWQLLLTSPKTGKNNFTIKVYYNEYDSNDPTKNLIYSNIFFQKEYGDHMDISNINNDPSSKMIEINNPTSKLKFITIVSYSDGIIGRTEWITAHLKVTLTPNLVP